jgi:orotate phosphoribosyltransferase
MLEEKELIENAFIKILMKMNALKIGTFKLSSGMLSPYYIDINLVLSDPSSFSKIIEIFIELIKRNKKLLNQKYLCGIPLAGLTFASVCAYKLNKPLIYIKKKERHDRERIIEGILKVGSNVLLIDDFSSTGNTLISTIDIIRSEGGIVTDALVLIDREEGAKKNLEKVNVTLHSLTTSKKVIKEFYKNGLITIDEYKKLIL